jgi:hypothetical protein
MLSFQTLKLHKLCSQWMAHASGQQEMIGFTPSKKKMNNSNNAVSAHDYQNYGWLFGAGRR